MLVTLLVLDPGFLSPMESFVGILIDFLLFFIILFFIKDVLEGLRPVESENGWGIDSCDTFHDVIDLVGFQVLDYAVEVLCDGVFGEDQTWKSAFLLVALYGFLLFSANIWIGIFHKFIDQKTDNELRNHFQIL